MGYFAFVVESSLLSEEVIISAYLRLFVETWRNDLILILLVFPALIGLEDKLVGFRNNFQEI